LHRQHEAAVTLTGDERAAVLAGLHADAASLHERHQVLLASLDPVVADELVSRVHEKMGVDHEKVGVHHQEMDTGSLHERMRRLHGAGHQRVPHRGPPAGTAPAWWARLAEAAPALAAAAVLALVAGAVWLGERAGPVPAAPDAIVHALYPDEPMLRTLLLTGSEPPPASVVVDLVALREDER
jgi:hypothetical protein